VKIYIKKMENELNIVRNNLAKGRHPIHWRKSAAIM
jgi:hypothetical protein